MRHFVACLDVWAPAVQDLVRRTAPSELDLHFARTYEWDEQIALVEQAEFLLPGWAEVTAPMLARARKLKMIQKWGIGVDRIDVQAVRQLGIPLAITAGSNAGPVAELAIALMLAVYRRLPYVNHAIREGQWPKAEMRESCFQIAGKTVGIVGFGAIGRMLAYRLRGFDAKVIYFDTHRANDATEKELSATYMALDELLAISDIVSLHAPFTPETFKMINAESIATMRDGVVLINTARGELVDEQALYQALTSGKLRGAGLDAFDPEPPLPSNPLLSLDQVVVTPHAGGGVFDNVENVARHSLGNIMRHLRGEALRPADIVVPAALI